MDQFTIGYATFGLLVIVGVGFYAAATTANRILRPSMPTPLKLTTYECGVEPVGDGWAQMNIRYYVFAFLFVIFDVETVFILPWTLIQGRLDDPQYIQAIEAAGLPAVSPLYALIVMGLFIVTLLEGLGYAYKKGVLRWE